jgi:hypothetical protein
MPKLAALSLESVGTVTTLFSNNSMQFRGHKSKKDTHKKKDTLQVSFSEIDKIVTNQVVKRQRFENWNERRAFARPYFLRSTTRESRVRKPPFFRTPRSSGSKLVSAFDRPWRTAPA